MTGSFSTPGVITHRLKTTGLKNWDVWSGCHGALAAGPRGTGLALLRCTLLPL